MKKDIRKIYKTTDGYFVFNVEYKMYSTDINQHKKTRNKTLKRWINHFL